MANYNVPSGTFSFGQTLTADTADTIQFADRAGYLTIANTGTSVIWVRADGQAATIQGEDCYAVLPGESAILANGLPLWYQSSRVIPQGVNQFGGRNTSDSPTNPGSVTPMESLAGQMTNPGTQISLVSSEPVAYSIAFAG